MAVMITKNAAAAAQRQCDLIVYQDGALTLAPRGTDFIALGILYQTDGANVPHYKVGAGTCVNKRKPLVVADFVFTADSGTDLCTKASHGLETGDGPFRVSNSGGALPGNLVAATDYWIYNPNTGGTGGNTFKFCTTLALAYAGTGIDMSSNGTGTQTCADVATTQRGLDGLFTYTFPQADTNYDIDEWSVLIDGAGYLRANNGGAYTTCGMQQSSTGFDITSGDGLTNQQKLNLAARFAGAKFTKVGSVYTWRDLADSKDSHSMTVVRGRADDLHGHRPELIP
jgi:hypothetical protein